MENFEFLGICMSPGGWFVRPGGALHGKLRYHKSRLQSGVFIVRHTADRQAMILVAAQGPLDNEKNSTAQPRPLLVPETRSMLCLDTSIA